jgi:hypothetical protein
LYLQWAAWILNNKCLLFNSRICPARFLKFGIALGQDHRRTKIFVGETQAKKIILAIDFQWPKSKKDRNQSKIYLSIKAFVRYYEQILRKHAFKMRISVSLQKE